MDVGAGDADDDVLSWYIRIATTVVVVGISVAVWYGTSGEAPGGASGMTPLRLKKPLRGLVVNSDAVVDLKEQDEAASLAAAEPALAAAVEMQRAPAQPASPELERRTRRVINFPLAQADESKDDDGQEGPSASRRQTMREKGRAWVTQAVAPLLAKFAGPGAYWLRHGVDKSKLKNKRPLVVFVNSRSGGGQGIQLLKELDSLLHMSQVVDLAKDKTPMHALKFWEKTELAYRILVCGGDGTVGWVLNTLEELRPKVVPPVAILPVGTGNDLARVMGWGGGFSGGSVLPELQRVQDAHPAFLDRWKVVYRDVPDERRPRELGDLPPRRQMVMCNYLGVGIDAAIALDFHTMRERSPHLFMSRLVNKVWYAKAGALSPYRSACLNLSQRIRIWCDGEELEVPNDIEGIVVLNIPSFGGGCDLWDSGEADSDVDEDDDEEHGEVSPTKTATEGFKWESEADKSLAEARQSMQDKRIEVLGVHGSFQLGAAQVGLYSAKRLRQASHIRILNKEDIPVQVDGEPEMFSRHGEIEIAYGSQALMLAHSDSNAHAVATEVIEWGISKGHIPADKRNELTKFIAKSASRLKSQSHRHLSEC